MTVIVGVILVAALGLLAMWLHASNAIDQQYLTPEELEKHNEETDREMRIW